MRSYRPRQGVAKLRLYTRRGDLSITCLRRKVLRIVLAHPKSLETCMDTAQFLEQLDARVAKYDLLCHPFYRAWSAGELTREDLQAYARDYYHHVEAFPIYLAELGIRLDESELRQAILANMADEKGIADAPDRTFKPHSELWLDFAEGMGAK